MEASAVFPDNLIMRDALSGDEVTRIPMGERALKHYGYPYAVIHRADLHQVLLDACRAQPLIELRNSAKVTAHPAGDDGVSVTQADGETIAGDSLIARPDEVRGGKRG